nr:rhodanese-like domain-containing protein [Haliscomenobacter sp.]
MDITVQELKEKLARGDDFVLIDVREPYEHEEFNVGGNLIPMGNFPMVIPTLDSHKDDEVVVYCRSGRRSASVQYQLKEAGFKNVRKPGRGHVGLDRSFRDGEIKKWGVYKTCPIFFTPKAS